MKVIYVSFYTPNYRSYADALRKCLETLELPHDIREIKCRGGFLANVRYKPQFLLEMLQEHKDFEAIVWVDSDALVNRRPSLLEQIKEDLGVYFLPLPRGRSGPKEELLSGTVYLRNTPKVHKMMEEWIVALGAAHSPNLLKPEQQVLQRILPKLGVTVFRLPRDYCWIMAPHHTVTPTIEHHQASRVTRYLKSGENFGIRRVSRATAPRRKRLPSRPGNLRQGKKLSYRRRLASPVRMPWGGIQGCRVGRTDIHKMQTAIEQRGKACDLDGMHKGGAILIVGPGGPGTASHSLLTRQPTLAYGNALDTAKLDPTYLLVYGRELYYRQHNSGRLHTLEKRGTVLLIARPVFDPAFLRQGSYKDMSRRAQPLPDYGIYVYDVNEKKPAQMSVQSFRQPLGHGGDQFIQALQAAAILGPRVIYLAGVKLAGSKTTKACLAAAVTALRDVNIRVINTCSQEPMLVGAFGEPSD